MRTVGAQWAEAERIVARFGLRLCAVADGQAVPGSYWGAPEAGLINEAIYARPDTPLHSVLHEACHVVCMSPARRARLHTDAGGDDLEECAVCFLQVVLAEPLYAGDLAAVCADMDAWGYSFRLGSAYAWFMRDANDARAWLLDHGLLDARGAPRYVLRDEPRRAAS